MDSGDIGFMLICTVLVLLMTPGVGFFYGGLGRRKNVVNNIMACMSMIAIGTVMWVLIGFSLTFGTDHGGIIGGLEYVMFSGVGFEAGPYSATIPFVAYAMFQMAFAILTPALLTGAIAGRMNFKALLGFVVLWTLLVYYPIAHMVWGGGFLGSIGSVDFAGGNVVHISSGVSGLVLCILLGRRSGYEQVKYRVHNIPLVAMGATMLFVGWFGFNAGSAVAANGLAAHAFATSAIATAAAELSWMILDVATNRKPTLVGACTGLVAGLVAITPACGFVPLWAALIIGLTASPICFFAISFLKRKLGYDDALDAFGCHGIGGIWGGICTGLFANQSINPALLWNGLVFGQVQLFGVQLLAICISIAWAAVGTLICAKLVSLVTPLRVSERDEKIGLDISQHGERAYPSFNGLDD